MPPSRANMSTPPAAVMHAANRTYHHHHHCLLYHQHDRVCGVRIAAMIVLYGWRARGGVVRGRETQQHARTAAF